MQTKLLLSDVVYLYISYVFVFLINSVNNEILRTIPLRVGAVEQDTFSDPSHIHHWSGDLPFGR